MVMKNLSALVVVFLVAILSAQGQIISEWRGPGRSGVYDEKGLLAQWPDKGPKMIMSVTGLPKGNSSVATGIDMLYIAGTRDSLEVVVALDMKGNRIWETAYGRSWIEAFPESRSTPTIEGDRIYVASGKLDAACIDAKSGNVIWSQRVADKFQGVFGSWGTSCSPLIVDNKFILTIGGNLTTLVALDKSTGEKVWATESLHDRLGYVSPCLIEYKGKKQIIALTERNVLGVSPNDGRILWIFDYAKYAGPDGKNNNTTTPLYADGHIYVTSGYNHNGVMLALSDDGNSVSLVWSDPVLDNHLGGVVHVGDYIYGSNWYNNDKGSWVCLNWETGKVMYETDWGNKGSIVAAEGMLYCYEEKKGNVGLVRATPEKFELVSFFKVPPGSGPHWAHPVIHNKVLYIRHGDSVMAYDIAAKQ
jgi:outer membrane protein assembly factor BamB